MRPDALHPGADGWGAAEVEAPFVGDVGVGVEGDVDDGVAIRDEEVVSPQVSFHHPEGSVAQLPLVLERFQALGRHLHAEVGPGT